MDEQTVPNRSNILYIQLVPNIHTDCTKNTVYTDCTQQSNRLYPTNKQIVPNRFYIQTVPNSYILCLIGMQFVSSIYTESKNSHTYFQFTYVFCYIRVFSIELHTPNRHIESGLTLYIYY